MKAEEHVNAKSEQEAVLVATTLVVLLGAGIASATIPDSGGTIHGCYKNVGGDLRVIDPGTGATCSPSETSLGWSQTGAKGRPGRRVRKESRAHRVHRGLTASPTTRSSTAQATTAVEGSGAATAFVSADCPSGTTATGGGFEIPASANVTPVNSSSDGQAWLVEATGDAGVTVKVFAVCVDKQQLGVN